MQGTLHLVEPFIENFRKFNSNTGWVSADDLGAIGDALQALSHFSYNDSSAHSDTAPVTVHVRFVVRYLG
jgi:hypothetical protein